MATPNPFDQQKSIPGVKHIIAVSSGKGGVGKSTVAINLAASLAKSAKVGLLDADIYGPSIPRMMGLINQRPQLTPDQKMKPILRNGIAVMSIGFLVDEGAAVVWRGPMLFKAIEQFLRDVEWGELDYLIVDLPPGTGDVQLSLAQKVPIAGAVVVSTPQNISLIDVKKAVDMFDRLGVKILGFVENMSYMINPATNEKLQLFPKGEFDQYLKAKGFLKLAEMPFNPLLGSSCEVGIPYVQTSNYENTTETQEFKKAADKISELLT